MLEQLFGSKTRLKILSFFYGQKNKKFYTQEIINQIGIDSANTHRELIKLQKLGVLDIEKVGIQKYYFLNKNYEYYPALEELFNVYNKKEEKDPWTLAEEFPDCDLFFSQIWLSQYVNEYEKTSGRAYKKCLCIYKGYHLWFYYRDKDSFEVGEYLVDKMMKSPYFARKVNLQIIKWSDKLRDFASRIPEDKLVTFSNIKLWRLYEKHDQIHTRFYQWGGIPVGADLYRGNFTNRLQNYLRQINVPEEKINEYFVVLTQPDKKSAIQVEREELLQLALKVSRNPYHKKLFVGLYQQFRDQEVSKLGLQVHSKEYEARLEGKIGQLTDKIRPDVMKDIQNYYLKYFYVKHMWVGNASTLEFYVKEIVKLVGTNADIAQILKDEQEVWKENIKKRDHLLKKLNIKGDIKIIFQEFADFMITKVYRRYAQIYAIYKMEFVQREITKRLGISLKQARFMLPQEVKKALLYQDIDAKELYERTKMCVYLMAKNEDVIITGPQAEKMAEEMLNVEIDQVDEFFGQTGCVGKAKGIVKIITRPEDMGKMNKGDILVSIATDPDIVPAMKKAAAIITELGGITSHAAIVARELNIPCVIGTKIAAKVLKDGDLVEVDANKGLVKILKRL